MQLQNIYIPEGELLDNWLLPIYPKIISQCCFHVQYEGWAILHTVIKMLQDVTNISCFLDHLGVVMVSPEGPLKPSSPQFWSGQWWW